MRPAYKPIVFIELRNEVHFESKIDDDPQEMWLRLVIMKAKTLNPFRFLTITLTITLTSTMLWCQPQVLVTGLQGPQKIIVTPAGNILVSETSLLPNSARVSLVTRGGTRSNFIENLPSGVEVTGGASGPTAMALRDRTLYLAIGGGDAERAVPDVAVTRRFNPEGISSPLFGSILECRFDRNIDTITGSFQFTPQLRQTLNDATEVDITNASGASVRVSILARFPMAEPAPAPLLYKFSNIWGLALSDDGRDLFVSDASNDSVSRVDTATGRWRRITRFPAIANPTPVGPPVGDAVPTSIRTYGNQLLVSFLTGFPFAPGNARVLAINPNGTTEPFIYGLTSATDIFRRVLPDGKSQFYVLEFSANQSAAAPPPGRLLRYDTAVPQVAAGGLITPVSLAYDEATKDLYILELRGQILRLRLD